MSFPAIGIYPQSTVSWMHELSKPMLSNIQSITLVAFCNKLTYSPHILNSRPVLISIKTKQGL